MKRKSLSSNFIFNLLYQALLYAVPLLTTPYLSRVLRPEGVGQYAFAQSVVSYFVLIANLGTALYGQRQIAAIFIDAQERTRIFWQIAALRFFTTLTALALYSGLILPQCGNLLLYLAAALEILAVAADISWFYQGIERFDVIALPNALCKLVAILCIFLFVRSSQDLVRYVVILCGMVVAGNLLQWLFLPRYLEKRPSISFRETFRHFYPALTLFVAQVAIQIYTVLDKTMIGLITKSDAQNAFYEQSQKLIRVLTVATTFIGPVVASRICSLWREKKIEEAKGLILSSFQAVFCISFPIVAGVCLVSPRFVPIFYGPGYEPIIKLLPMLTLLPLAVGCSNITGIQYLVPTNRENRLTQSVLAGAAVNFLLNFFWIPQYQAFGAAAASVTAETVVTAVQLFFVRRELNIRSILARAPRYLLFCLPMYLIGRLLDNVLPQGIFGLIAMVFICAAVYAAELAVTHDPSIAFLFGMKRKNSSKKE